VKEAAGKVLGGKKLETEGKTGTLVGRRMVTSCRDIFFILRTTSALRTSEAVTCPMIAPLGVRPRG
jgi:hypothetical protein